MSREAFEAAINVLAGQTETKQKKRLCELCESDKAVGKYYVHPDESENHGWWRVCSCCAATVSRVGANVQYYKYSKEYKQEYEFVEFPLPENVKCCDHHWEKWGNVGEHDKKRDAIFDWMRCNHCGVYGKRFGLGQQPIVDLMMEIDLSCSR
ncbi:hypothetical protein GOP97_14815 [Vibrio cholerae]|uniref:hypothetical protein n=1 Tax=Vibrio cholerae TaxID=666 RepID=UPI002DBBF7D9|nr:hypothetical protein [Vibrio cholerae]MEB5557038.1 hypothetical protein [Vibrio cholerae]